MFMVLLGDPATCVYARVAIRRNRAIAARSCRVLSVSPHCARARSRFGGLASLRACELAKSSEPRQRQAAVLRHFA